MFKILYPRRVPEHQSPALAVTTFCLCTVWLIALQRSGAFEHGKHAFLVGLMAAALPAAVVYVPLALLVDRYEKEPRWMLAAAFLWGATVAVFLAAMLNPLVGGASPPVARTGVLALLDAPSVRGGLVEELVKGTALLLLFLWQRDEFDNSVDGIVYAIMVGLGFAMTENVSQYARAWSAGRLDVLLMVRGGLSPFSHPLFTMMTGIGLGLAREWRSRWAKVIAPLLGLGMAVILHMEWNGFIEAGLFYHAYVGVMVPTFLFMIYVVMREQAREREIIRDNLRPYMEQGALSEDELETLCRLGGRLRALRVALRTGGRNGFRCEATFQQAATELAFHRWRVGRGISRGAFHDGEREREYLRLIADTRACRPSLAWG